jgi:hypothetical protein
MSNSIGIGFSPSSNGKSGWSTGGVGAFAFLIPGLGHNIYINNDPTNGRPSLGGGFRGIMPQSVIDHDNSDEFAQMRFTLRQAWNTTKYSGQGGIQNTRIVTPFRAVNNAGDVLSRQNYSCGGTCQSFQSRPGLNGLKQRFGSNLNTCTPSALYSGLQVNPGVPASACNVKFVYDGSDYTKFLRQKAMNKTYNDRSFGGDDYNASQDAIRHIKRY